NEMMMVMLTVGAAELGEAKAVGDWIHRNLVGYLKPPFNVRSETADNNNGYILATSAGFVQSFIYGLSGLRIDDKGLDAKYAPILPPDWKAVTLKGITFRGRHYDVTIERGAGGKATLVRKEL
ncbi:MAG TPA: glycosyl hydrolase family 65 protein, partial [Rhodanobacteraceae bacterium]|nr:glycosyl hydrolase family 65 protein [Rhodanobacteraceae bacterium]